MDGALPQPTPINFHYSGNIRRYYVAAEEVTWDFAPTGWDNWLGLSLKDSPRAQAAGIVQQGTKWQKAVYRGYTDATFTTPVPQPAWQGVQGPTLRSEVGDMIEILFVNRLQQNYASMHSMGLAYSKDNEGSLYPNNTSPGLASPVAPGSAVAPGGCTVYKWLVSDGAAPPPGQPSQQWGYHSYVSFPQDSYAGLIGSQIVYQPGQMKTTMASYREFALLFMDFDESQSFMSAVNAHAGGRSGSLSARGSPLDSSHNPANDQHGVPSAGGSAAPSPSSSFAPSHSSAGTSNSGNYSIWHPQLVNLGSSGQIGSAPKFYTLNGYVFANGPSFEMCLNDKVIWYVYAYGSASHVFHMHGNGFVEAGMPNMNRASIGTSMF